jgi:bacillithiol system protein YtxJ
MLGIFKGYNGSDVWSELNSIEQLKELYQQSDTTPVILFKHSTRCSISSMAKSRIESNWSKLFSDLPIYYLDLIAHRNISNSIAEDLGIEHQSPQIIVVKNGQAIYDTSHGGIDANNPVEILS